MPTFPLEPTKKPPRSETGIILWLKSNIFYSWTSSIYTLILLYIFASILVNIANWAIFDASFLGDDRSFCEVDGACWTFIGSKMRQFIYGFYPIEELWRPTLAFFLSMLMIVLLFSPLKHKFSLLGICSLVLFILSSWLLYGGLGLAVVDTSKWGGLLITMYGSFVAIFFSLPLGILLALGRINKNMPIIRYFCVVNIEFWRGVPLITILFMASTMFPFFVPPGTELDKLLRALIGLTLFQSAYIAESLRGGMQSISQGQYEAADSINLSYWQKMRLVILPLSMRVAIPNFTGNSISLIKDSSLFMIIGLFDLLNMVIATSSDTSWLGFETEGYVFVGFIFWMLCFGVSKIGKLFERTYQVRS